LEYVPGRDFVDLRGCLFSLEVKIGWRSLRVVDGASVASPWFDLDSRSESSGEVRPRL
jgi:hypothetical protein